MQKKLFQAYGLRKITVINNKNFVHSTINSDSKIKIKHIKTRFAPPSIL